jgi:hypothetical protein
MAASKDLLFGKIALSKGYCTREQIDKGLAIQVASGGGIQLGEILLREGFLTPGQHSEILTLQKQAFAAVDPVLKKNQEAVLFGKLALREGLITEEELNECLRLQGRDGERRTLGEIMVAHGYLTPFQVTHLLSRQEKRIMSCPACRLSYTVLTVSRGKVIHCPRCRGPLQEGKPSDSVRTDAEFDTTIVRALRSEVPGAGDGPAPPRGGGLKITCFICRTPFEGAQDAGGRVRCPHCHATFTF